MTEYHLEYATLGGGCFWCLEAAFDQVIGVKSAVSGYCGGHTDNPDYHAVCAGNSGHAEVVRITFDPAEIGYRDVLEIFFAIHDPTTLNRQGNDVGTQYRSVIYYHSPEQSAVAESLLAELGDSGLWSAPIVTQLLPAPQFYPAEDYHQRYFSANPNQPYCQAVVSPKLAKFRKKFASRLKSAR